MIPHTSALADIEHYAHGHTYVVTVARERWMGRFYYGVLLWHPITGACLGSYLDAIPYGSAHAARQAAIHAIDAHGITFR